MINDVGAMPPTARAEQILDRGWVNAAPRRTITAVGSTDPGHGLAAPRAGARLTGPVTAPADSLPGWARLYRAPNPGPMTLSGTNSWLLRAVGARGAVAVDPGPDDREHLARLADAGPIELILVTHGHPDHVEGLARFADLTGAPIRSADPTHGTPVTDGAILEAAGLRIEVLATPGHTADSVSYLVRDAADPAVLTGDTVLGAGSTVVMWPDGDLGAYLASLDRLHALGPLPVLPGHGPALADCAAAAAGYRAHRQSRLDQVRSALHDGADGADAVLDAVYPGLDSSLRAAAERTVRAQLAYLADDTAGRDREHQTHAGPLDKP